MNNLDLKKRLDTLYDDLMFTSDEALSVLRFVNETSKDKKKFLRDAYFKENSPVKVLNTQFTGKGEADVTGEMIKVSENFDDFIINLQNKAMILLLKHDEAVKLLFALLSLRYPYSGILYSRYFKKLTPRECFIQYRLSRTTFFRMQSEALDSLQKKLSEK